MSHLPSPATRRPSARRIVMVAGVAALAVAGTLATGTLANAANSTVFTITGVSPHLVAATTVNQVISITGTGFDEAAINATAGVVVTATSGTCAVSFIVASPTLLLAKTDNTCGAGVATITVKDLAGNTAVSATGTGAAGVAQALSFVAPPTLRAFTDDGATPPVMLTRPVLTNNTAGNATGVGVLPIGSQGTSASTKGGAVIRIYSGATAFNASTLPVSVTLDGVALTNVTVVGATTAPNYITGIVGAHAVDATPVLRITNQGVSKSFISTGTTPDFDFAYAGSTITVTPAFGPSTGGTVTITGAGFSTTPASNVVTFGALTATVTVSTATSLTVTVPAANGSTVPYEGVVAVTVVSGGVTSVISSGSAYTYVKQ